MQDIQHSREVRTQQPVQSEARLHEIAEMLHDLFYSLDVTTGRIVYVNPAYEKVWGRTCESLDADPTSYTEAIHHKDRQAVKLAHQEATGGGTLNLEYRIVRPDGDIRWIHDIAHPVRNANGSVDHIVGTARDITEHKQAQQAIDEGEERFRNMAKATHDALYYWDATSDNIWWSEGMQILLGLSPEEIGLGIESWVKRIHPDDKDRVLRHGQGFIEGGDGNWIDAYRLQRRDGSYAYVMDRGCAIRNSEGKAVRTVGGITDLTARRQSEMERDRLHKEKILLLESTGEGIWGIDAAGCCTFINGAAARMLGYEVREVLGKHMHRLTHHQHADGSPYPVEHCPMYQAFQSGHSCRREDEVFWRKDGTPFPVTYSSYPMLDEGRAIGSVVTFSDITERQQAKQEIMRINRALQMRGLCSELMIRATHEMGLLTDVCRLAVDTGGYRLAWVGYAQDDESRSITTAAYAGGPGEGDFLNSLRLTWSGDQPAGQCPAANTVRSGTATVIQDIAEEPMLHPMLAEAQQHGYRGLVCLPLRDNNRTFGILSLYSIEVRPIPLEEVKLLQALADDLAFGIGNLRSREERRRIQSAVLKVAVGVSSSTGTEFFYQLARNMADAVGAQAGFVVRLLATTPRVGRTISVVIDGEVKDNFEYVLEGAPGADLVSAAELVVLDKVGELYCHAQFPSALGMQAFVGRRLDNAAGQPVGLLFVMYRQPLVQPGFVTSTLQIFATRVAAELERQEADARILNQASLLDKAQDAIIVRGIDHRIQFWNKGAERLYGWTPDEVIGCSAKELLYDDPAAFADATGKVLGLGEWSGENTQRRKDGSLFTVEGRWTLVRDDDGEPQSILCINTDITQRKESEREIQHLAFYDSLTQLPNRQLLLNRLQHALANCARAQSAGALLFIDLDNFKTLNDTLGHDKGDQLLQQVGRRLVSCVRTSDTVARLGGDEFVVMLEGLSRHPHDAAAHAKSVGEQILVALAAPYQLSDHGHFSTPSIGVTLFNDRDTDVGELLKRADLAMYQAKAAGRNTMRFFDREMQFVVTARAALEADLRQALLENKFLLHYQPQVNCDGDVIGAEALLRWQHPQRGMISPAEFIPLAEDTGLILPLGCWVLETACAQLAAWSTRAGTAHLTVAVNVSARQFRQTDFVEQVLTVLKRSGADPRKLKLELTESLLVDNMDETIDKMTALKAEGVGFSLDDFGTGYSSLAYLKKLPLDQLKIDQSFVRDVLTVSNDATIARTIVALGQSLGLSVIAEGVETQAQRDFLASHHCDAYQGYLFSRPVPAEQFDKLMSEGCLGPH